MMTVNGAKCARVCNAICLLHWKEGICLIFVFGTSFLPPRPAFEIIKVSFKMTKPFTRIRPICASVMYLQ